MKRAGFLFDMITTFPNLWRVAHKAWRGKKDKTRIANFIYMPRKNNDKKIIIIKNQKK